MKTIYLKELLARIQYKVVVDAGEIRVDSITFDSRKIGLNSLFVARKGERVDGHSFVLNAILGGAKAIVGERFDNEMISTAQEHHVSLVSVENATSCGGVIAAAYYDYPMTKMTMIGVTGTDGKTTTTNAVYELLRSRGKKVGLISTVSARIFDGQAEREMDTGLHVTTPESTEIQRLLSVMVENGCDYAVVEATSHGFVQGRLSGINFDVVGITNITHEHLDYHRNFEDYLKAKAKIFDLNKLLPLKEGKRVAYINADDSWSEGFKAYASDWELRTFSINGHGLLNIELEKVGLDETRFDLGGVKFKMNLVGKYNAANIGLAIGICQAMGFGLSDLVDGVAQLKNPPGRFEVVHSGAHGKIIVDFAHTPHAMESILSFVRNHHMGKLYVVFGCAGLRDIEKRPMMGRIGGRLADVSIVTAEDPRTEKVEQISAEIESGLRKVGAKELKLEPNIDWVQSFSEDQKRKVQEAYNMYLLIPDRFQAIMTAIVAATANDAVLILGKGHEQSMCFGEEERPWNDRKAIEQVLSQLEKV